MTEEMTAAPPSLFEAVIAFFEVNEWPHARFGAETILRVSYQGDNGEWMCTARVREEVGQMIFYSVLPVEVPPAKRQAMAEFLVRANYTLLIGNFEMDFADGEVFLRTYGIADSEQGLGAGTIAQLILGNVMMMDKYLPGIMAVISQDVTPEAAMAQFEVTAHP